MEHEQLNLKKPIESQNYREDSDFVIGQIRKILQNRISNHQDKVVILTNLKSGLPLENINKLAGPLIEAWIKEVFLEAVELAKDDYFLNTVTPQGRLDLADFILDFKHNERTLQVYIDVKATSENISKSGKRPNITSYSRIRTEYVHNPDFLFIILSVSHKMLSFSNSKTGEIGNVMQITAFDLFDLKYLGDFDIGYNPSLGKGQIQIRDIRRIRPEHRDTLQFCKMLDRKFLQSPKKDLKDFMALATENQWLETE